jgi:PHD/YefM family antitoxin component YafN of YafNO toxin-antitoxin module
MWRRRRDRDPVTVLRAQYDAAVAAYEAALSRFQEASGAWVDLALYELLAADWRRRQLLRELRQAQGGKSRERATDTAAGIR